MLTITIAEIDSNQANSYKNFFVQGLIQDEENFRISANDEEYAPFPTQNRSDSFTLGAYTHSSLVGVVSFERDGAIREKLRHKGTIFRMFIAREFRAQGVGKNLMEEVIQRVKNLGDIEKINLTVVALNHTAKQLYEKYGFKVFSVEENAIKWKGKYFTEESLVLELK